uniref:Uncharacterized protein n=1 Tax=Tetranychus urticae TaxID=32264 RepID=T1JR45_TETUR
MKVLTSNSLGRLCKRIIGSKGSGCPQYSLQSFLIGISAWL